MKKQTPALGIMKTGEYYDGTQSYRVACSCQHPDDDINFWIEYEEGFDHITVQTYLTHRTPWYARLWEWDVCEIESTWLAGIVDSVQSLVNGLHHRLRVTYEVWVRGYVKYESTTILEREQARNYAHAILDGIERLEKFHAKKKKHK